MSNQNVRVTSHPTTGEVITKSENPEWGSIRVEQERFLFDDATGFMKARKISALVHGQVKDLERMGWTDGMMVNGKIIFREQMVPFRKGADGQKDIKMAGDTGIPCTVGGEPIYRQTFYSSNSNTQDVPVQHDNSEQIKAAYAESQEKDAQIDL